MVRITLSGYYGCGNTGDEAVLAGILESFTQRVGAGAVEFTVLSANARDTRDRHGLAAIDRMNLRAIRRTILASDLLISGGGSLLQDTTSFRSLVYYLWIVRMALWCKRPVMFYGQGIGPLRRRISRVLTRIVANRVQHVTVRDEESAALLRRIGVCKPSIEVTADPAFALSPASPGRAREILAEAGALADRPFVGIAVRPWPSSPAPGEYAAMADAVAGETGAQIVFLPMQQPQDVALSAEIVSAMRVPACQINATHPPSEVLAVMHELSSFVAMRLHALVFGAMTGVPMVALSYDPKVSQFMARLGQANRCVPLTEFEPGMVAKRLAEAMEDSDSVRDSLRTHTAEMRELALVNVDRALSVVRPT